MKSSKPGNSVYLNVGIWYDEDQGHIHMTAKGVEGFHTTVCNDPASKRGHPNLFGKLAKCLHDAGAPSPKIESVDTDGSTEAAPSDRFMYSEGDLVIENGRPKG